MTYVLINPGTGPVRGALLSHAWRNIRQLRRDIAKRVPYVEIVRKSEHDHEGRYAFELRAGNRATRRCLVEMPGRPLEEVRDLEERLPAIPPRLYVDGSSWFWFFSVGRVVEALGGGESWGGGPCP